MKSLAPGVVSVMAPAKINLSFDILGIRKDKYHDILTLFQAVDLYDHLRFRFSPTQEDKLSDIKILLQAPGKAIEQNLFPLGAENSITRAIKLFLTQTEQAPQLDIDVTIEKQIPIGAGLAGGSTDAAATLVAMNYYWGNRFNNRELIALASRIGSDVAFCLAGGSAVGRGRGEILEPIDLKLSENIILVKPRNISVSTPWAFSKYDELSQANSVNLDSSKQNAELRLTDLIAVLSKKSMLNSQSGNDIFWNDFEPVIFREIPVLSEIKNYLLEQGCTEAHLTGSGPTIYGLVRDKEDGLKLQKILNGLTLTNEMQESTIILDSWLATCISDGARIKP